MMTYLYTGRKACTKTINTKLEKVYAWMTHWIAVNKVKNTKQTYSERLDFFLQSLFCCH